MEDDDGQTNRNPAVERTMAILNEIERHPDGLGLKQISERTGVTRSSAYRILNSLAAHDMVRQVQDSNYVLGQRLLSLASSVTVGALGAEVAFAAQPHLDRFAADLGETIKVSVYDRGLVVVVAISLGRRARALQAQVGEHLPIHAGAGSKVLLANLPESEVAIVLARKLARFTERTLTGAAELRAELARVREQGWSFDPGEFDLSVNACAAPVRDSAGRVVAAVSVPFLAGDDPAYAETARRAAQETAARIGANLTI